jgi:hypothetical protein
LLDPETLDAGLKSYQELSEVEVTPLRQTLERVEDLLKKKQQRLERLLELYLDEALPKEEYTANRKSLEADIAAAENERRKIQTRLNVETLTPERIADIHEFAQKIGEGLKMIDGDIDFDVKRQIINLLDVKIKLAVEDGQQVVYASCVLDINVPLNLRGCYTNSKTPRWIS